MILHKLPMPDADCASLAGVSYKLAYIHDGLLQHCVALNTVHTTKQNEFQLLMSLELSKNKMNICISNNKI